MHVAGALGDLVDVRARQVLMPIFVFGIYRPEKFEQGGIHGLLVCVRGL
jgi:hypothetical protein